MKFLLPALFLCCCPAALVQAATPSQAWTEIVRIDPAHPHHFIGDDGRRLFLFNKTAWYYFSAVHPEITLDRATRLGANVIRAHLEGRIYFSELGFDAWPWGGTREHPDYTSFNDAYWDKVEVRLRQAAARGIGINLTLFQSLHLPDTPESFALMQPYLERVIARLAPHRNIFCWEIHNEWARNPKFQDAVGRFLKARDPQHRPVISSEGTTDNPLWPDSPWMDLALVHHCTGSTPQYDLRDWYLGIAQNLRVHGKPAFNNETGREVRHQNDDPDHRRKQLWISAAAGGYTTWHSGDGCEGIDDASYVAPGEQFVRPFVRWWSEQEYWRVDPVHTVMQLAETIRYAMNSCRPCSRRQAETLCSGTCLLGAKRFRVDQGRIQLRLPDGDIALSFSVPPTRRPWVTPVKVDAPGLRRQVAVALPSFCRRPGRAYHADRDEGEDAHSRHEMSEAIRVV
jgi:hypothetical protein